MKQPAWAFDQASAQVVCLLEQQCKERPTVTKYCLKQLTFCSASISISIRLGWYNHCQLVQQSSVFRGCSLCSFTSGRCHRRQAVLLLTYCCRLCAPARAAESCSVCLRRASERCRSRVLLSDTCAGLTHASKWQAFMCTAALQSSAEEPGRSG